MNSNNLKFMVVAFLILITTGFLNACPVCERNQPKVFKGVIHGAGPDQWDYVTMWVVISITIASLYYSIKWIIKPGEKELDHIKYSILKDE